MKIATLVLLTTILLLTLVGAVEQADTEQEIGVIMEAYSHMPILHIFYNRHFGKSRQFEDFKDVINEVELDTKKYAKIIFTNCENSKGKR